MTGFISGTIPYLRFGKEKDFQNYLELKIFIIDNHFGSVSENGARDWTVFGRVFGRVFGQCSVGCSDSDRSGVRTVFGRVFGQCSVGCSDSDRLGQN